jgi:pimeloyl-ACP methyl ester carboxylesterase
MGHPPETAEGVSDELAEAWYRMEQLPNFEPTWKSLLPAVLSLRGANSEAAFTPADLRAVRSEVRLIWGSEDPFGDVETGRVGAEHFREASFHEIGTGHLPWLDEPARCGALVREFLSSDP